jgi:uncharacterized membrane protein
MVRKPRRPTPPAAVGPDDEGSGTRIIHHAHWRGPLPPPAQLEEFERIVPGGAARIFQQFEDEAKHRRVMETTNARFVIRDTHIGQALAGLYAVTAFGVTTFAIVEGAYWVAGVLGGGTIVGGIVAFLRGSKLGKGGKERQ